MFALLRKYPVAILFSVLLHGGLVAALIYQINKEPETPGIDLTGDAPIQAVAVSEADIQAEVERLQALEEQQAQQARDCSY